MRQFVNYLLLTVLGLVFLSGCQAQKAIIRGPEGEIAYKVTLPDEFDPTKDQCLFNARFDPKDPPEYIRWWGLYKLGREYLVTTQQLDIYGTAAAYQGPVLLLHGDRDGIVPMWCSERYLEAYGPHATLKVVEGENHTITRRRKQVVAETVEFFRGVFGR